MIFGNMRVEIQSWESMLPMYIQLCPRPVLSVALWRRFKFHCWGLYFLIFVLFLFFYFFAASCFWKDVSIKPLYWFFFIVIHMSRDCCAIFERREVASRQVCCDGQRRLRFIHCEWMCVKWEAIARKKQKKKFLLSWSLTKVALRLRG